MVECDLADGLTHHQRADDGIVNFKSVAVQIVLFEFFSRFSGRYGRLSNARHSIRDLPVPPHLFSQLNQHREGLDFLRMSGTLSNIFAVRSVVIRRCSTDTN